MRIALLVIATGKYTRFVGPLWDSAKRHFFTGDDLALVLFTDQVGQLGLPQQRPDGRACAVLEAETPHAEWPGPTLLRYHRFTSAAPILQAFDYLFYCDADMRFEADVGREILGRLVAVEHPGFCGRPRSTFTYEGRPESAAFIAPNEGTRYFAGGFQGGGAADYLRACAEMARGIDEDLGHGLTAVWHDESHWNRYCASHPPDRVLSPLYCSPEPWHAPGRRLVALEKNHAEVRS